MAPVVYHQQSLVHAGHIESHCSAIISFGRCPTSLFPLLFMTQEMESYLFLLPLLSCFETESYDVA